jgi:hypothetical protein
MKLLNGDILTDDMRNAMWTLPDNQSSFGYGWNITTAKDDLQGDPRQGNRHCGAQ